MIEKMDKNNKKLKQLRKNNKLYEENLRTNQEDYRQAIEDCINGKNNNNYNNCLRCGWRLADPDPCEGCINGNLYTHINHQNDNEI